MSKNRADSKQQLQRAEEFARKALSAVSRKPVSETKVKTVARRISKTMAEVLQHA